MSKEEIIKDFINYLNQDIQHKDFLTYQEQDEWKDYINRIIDNQVKEKDKEIERLNKDLDTAIEICNNRQKEIVKLNNIIDELEKELKEGSFDVYFCSTSSEKTFKSNEIIIKAMILDKLKELKGSDK